MFPGEVYAFYINFTDRVNDPNFDSFRLDLINDATGETVLEGIGTLEKDEIEFGFYNILCSFSCPDVVFGWYRLQIWDQAANSLKAISNPLNIEKPEYVKNTAFLVYRNNEDLFNIQYEKNPDFYNKIRLPLIQLGDIKGPADRKQYRNVSDKRLRNYRTYKDLTVKLQSYKYNEFGHLAAEDMYLHDTIFVDNTAIVPKSEYERDEDIRAELTNASIEAYIIDLEPPASAAAMPEFLANTQDLDEILGNRDYIIINP